jgi:predicted lysophospholipase L1 biosynthesis ABC-type transport system permease subunit
MKISRTFDEAVAQSREIDREAEAAAVELAESLDFLQSLVAGQTEQLDGVRPDAMYSMFGLLKRAADVARKPYR